MKDKLLYLNQTQVEACGVDILEIIDTIEASFKKKAEGRTELPLKPTIHPRPECFLRALAGYIGGFLFKGIRTGMFKPALKGIRDGLRLENRQTEKPALSEAALEYIQKHEFEPRGSAWKRLVSETVIPPGRAD